MNNNFDTLLKVTDRIAQYENNNPAIKFYQQELLRFISIAGTLKENLLEQDIQNIDSRYFTHILTRSLLENFFNIIYVFDNNNKKEERFNELLDSFKRDYIKLYKEPELPCKDKLSVPNDEWGNLERSRDIRSILTSVRNEHKENLNYLYFIYRVTSFDIHGKNLPVFLNQSFGDNINFPILKLNFIFELIASEYLEVASKYLEIRYN